MDHTTVTAAAAARNNAEWCAAVCRTHGIPHGFGAAAWWSARRTPPYYPDAVTLRPDAREDDVLRLIDTTTPGCSLKDSFAALDLVPYGFTPLLHGSWFHRPAAAPGSHAAGSARTGTGASTDTRATTVRDAGLLAAWVAAWHGGSDGAGGAAGAPPDVFRPALLRDPAVRVLALLRDGELTGGAVLNLGAGLVGVTNVFALGPATPSRVWEAVVRAAEHHFSAVPLVGYVAHATPSGNAPGNGVPAGFRPLGPLRVWHRPGGGHDAPAP